MNKRKKWRKVSYFQKSRMDITKTHMAINISQRLTNLKQKIVGDE